MESLWLDLKYALRTLRRGRMVIALVVLSLGLAIAGNVTVFGLINGLLWRPLPYPEPERLSVIGEKEKGAALGALGLAPTSPANFDDWRRRQTSYQSFGGFRPTPMALAAEGRSERLAAAAVSPEFFEALATTPMAGRLFLDDEAIPGNDRVAVLTHGFWRSRYGGGDGAQSGNPSAVVGQTLQLNDESFQVVGVLPERFEFLDPSIQLFLPLALEAGDLPRQTRDLYVVGRLADGVSEDAARAEMTAIAEELEREYPAANRGYASHVVNLREEIPDPRNRQLFGLLQGVLLLVLLIACANAANLLLARSLQRQREIALRASLGAGRGRLIRLMMTESAVVAILGGAVGLVLGVLGLDVLGAAVGSQLPSHYMPVLDGRVLLFSLGLTGLAALLFGLAPSFWGVRVDLVESLKEGGRSATASGGRRLVSNGLVALEIACALVLLSAAGVLISTINTMRNADPGFDTESLVIASTTLPEASYGDTPQLVGAVRELGDRLSALPGVASAAAASAAPRSPFVPHDTYLVPSQPLADGQPPPRADWMSVTPGFFETSGIRLLQGRTIDWRDEAESEPVVVINRALAEAHWSVTGATGQMLEVQGEPRRVVGVVDNVLHGLLGADRGRTKPALYLPFGQMPVREPIFVARANGEPTALVEPLRRTVTGFGAGLAAGRVQPLETYLDELMVGNQVFSTILSGFGVLALLLSAFGTYGVLAYSVAQRKAEIGIRRALGASTRQVIGLVLRQGLLLAVVGLVVGVPGVLAASTMVGRALRGVADAQPAAVLPIALILLAVTVVAGILPSWRAARVDPNQTLRDR